MVTYHLTSEQYDKAFMLTLQNSINARYEMSSHGWLVEYDTVEDAAWITEKVGSDPEPMKNVYILGSLRTEKRPSLQKVSAA